MRPRALQLLAVATLAAAAAAASATGDVDVGDVSLSVSAAVVRTAQPRGTLRGQTVLITGASSGIGRAVAYWLATYAEANVVVGARTRAKLDSLVGEIDAAVGAAAGRALAVTLDVTRDEQVAAAFAAAVAKFGAVHHVFANAGYLPSTDTFLDTADEDARSIDVNYLGVRRTMLAALREFERRRGGADADDGGGADVGGTFIVTSSPAGVLPTAFTLPFADAIGDRAFAYAAAKAAVNALVRASPYTEKRAAMKVYGLNPVVYDSVMARSAASRVGGVDNYAAFNPIYPGVAGDPMHLAPAVLRLLGGELDGGRSYVCDSDACVSLAHLGPDIAGGGGVAVEPARLLDNDLNAAPRTKDELAARGAELKAQRERMRELQQPATRDEL